MAMIIMVNTLEGARWPLEVDKRTTMGEIRTKMVYFAKAGDYALDGDGDLICFDDFELPEKDH